MATASRVRERKCGGCGGCEDDHSQTSDKTGGDNHLKLQTKAPTTTTPATRRETKIEDSNTYCFAEGRRRRRRRLRREAGIWRRVGRFLASSPVDGFINLLGPPAPKPSSSQ
jgi:hypothetical protein